MVSDRKKEKFIELAEKRTRRIIINLDLIGNLSNKRNYIYTDEQCDQIFKAIKKGLREAEEKFIAVNRGKETTTFSLRD